VTNTLAYFAQPKATKSHDFDNEVANAKNIFTTVNNAVVLKASMGTM
jgi:hypothetical protein